MDAVFGRFAAAAFTVEGRGQAGDLAVEVAAVSAELVESVVFACLALAVGTGSLCVAGPLAGSARSTLGRWR
jgi:hypothetical protein